MSFMNQKYKNWSNPVFYYKQYSLRKFFDDNKVYNRWNVTIMGMY